VFDRVGLFSGDFPRGQDLELIIRVWRANGRGMYAPDMQVSHRIPADRLTKQYHRMWHTREGDIRARVQFREIFDRENRVIAGRPAVARLMNVPRFLFRDLLAHGARWALAMVRRDGAGAFAHEGQLRQTSSYIQTCFSLRRAVAPSRPSAGAASGRLHAPGA
jgi:GT2 family glycosyltransferase